MDDRKKRRKADAAQDANGGGCQAESEKRWILHFIREARSALV